jgi:hypothetical protein
VIFAACLAVDSSCATGAGYTGLDDDHASYVGSGGSGQSFLAGTGQLLEYKLGSPPGAQSATFGAGSGSDNVILGLVAFGPDDGQAPPVRSNGQPTGTLPAGTTQTNLSLTTDETATCRYGTSAGVAYASLPNIFSSTGGLTHTTLVTGLSDGGSYNYYVRCQDNAGNANSDDLAITFSVSAQTGSSPVTSSLSGIESPLSENGMWDSPGVWADLQKDNGAYAVGSYGLAAMGRLVAPLMTGDQYAEITYAQDPGSSSWVGVTTRVQGAGNGSCYLAIVYAGQAQLYRTDDDGSLHFTLLASASTDNGAAPRRLRLESQGNNHRVYLNGVQVISHTASGTLYTNGQPGIAAAVLNSSPSVKIFSFEGGELGSM